MSAAHSAGPQMALNLRLRDEATLENFLPTEKLAPLLPLLRGQLTAGGEAVILLHGAADTGKTHLLQAGCHLAGSGGLYMPLAELRAYPPEAVLADMESLAIVCLDDIDAIAGDAGWEQALFHFFNRARAAGCRLLLSAGSAPRGMALQLEDLRSRLSWGVVYHLPGYSDEEKVELLAFRAVRRGLQMPTEVARYVVTRAPRGLGQLLALLDRLDRTSLAEQRALTVPFVKRVLSW